MLRHRACGRPAAPSYPGRMTGTVPTTGSPSGRPEPAADRTADANALAVLGMLGSLQLSGFSRLAADAVAAPDLGRRLELVRLAGTTLERLEQVAERVAELGSDLEAAMAPYAGMLTDFDARTTPSSWEERLLKSYVGYEVADDFCRTVGEPLPEPTRGLVREALSSKAQTALVVRSLEESCAHDATLAARLALWGRRLVGEALTVVQKVIADRPELRDLVVQAYADAPPGEAQTRLFAHLTAEHSRRMERLGLTP